MSEPDGDGETPRRLHPASLIIGVGNSIRSSILALLPVAGSFAFMDRPLVSVPIALVGLFLLAFFPFLGWLRFRYAIGPDALVIESGVLSRNRRVIPYERVQDIDVERGLVARLSGTALVKVETGGAAADEGALDVVTLAEAERLRAAIRAWRGGAPTADASSEPLVDDVEHPLYAIGLGRVLLSGLLGFSLVYLAVMGGILQYIEPWLDGTRFSPPDIAGDWVDRSREQGRINLPGRDDLSADLGGVRVVGLLALAAIALGALTGIVLALLRDYGFRLTATPAGFRVRKGLLTLKEVQIPRARVQRLILTMRVLMRPFGLWRLELGTLGGVEGGGGTHMVAPLARIDEVTPILAELERERLPAADEWRRGNVLAIAARAVTAAVPLSVVAIGLALLSPVALALLPLLIPIGIAAWLAWRGEKHVLIDDALHIRTGLIGRKHVIVPLRRIQSMSVDSGPIERRLGLSRVAIDVAGASMASRTEVSGLTPDDARALLAALLDGRRRFSLRSNEVVIPDQVRDDGEGGNPR